MANEKIEEELVLELIKDNRNHCRHHEAQRTIMTNLILVMTAVLGGVITFDKNLDLSDIVFSLSILLLGIFGVLFSLKFGARSEYHWDLGKYLINELSSNIYDKERLFKSNYEYRPFYRKKIRWYVINVTITEFWVYLHSFIALIGLLITLVILFVVLYGSNDVFVKEQVSVSESRDVNKLVDKVGVLSESKEHGQFFIVDKFI